MNEGFTAAQHDQGCYKKALVTHFLVFKGLSNDDVGVARGTVFRENAAGSGFQNRRFRCRKVNRGGAAVVRHMLR